MKRITFARHGQTESNSNKVYNHKEERLSAQGQLQAQQLAASLVGEDFDLVICSPAQRTQETASYLSQDQLSVLERWDEVIEVDWGPLEGQPYMQGYASAFGAIEDGHCQESLTDIEARSHRFWDKINTRPEMNILVVSHGAIMCTFYAIKDGYKAKDLKWYRENVWTFMDNCDTKVVTL